MIINRKEYAFTLVELLVTLVIVAAIFGGLLKQYTSSVQTARDQSIRIAVQAQAQAVTQSIISDLRTLGNGVPYDQANFQIGESTLADPTVTEPLVVAQCTASKVAFRLNETGEVNLLRSDFNPAATTEVELTGVGGLDANDPIYISNSVVGGDDGLYGTIEEVDVVNKVVKLNLAYDASPGAIFDMGSIFEEVPVVSYETSAEGNIIRNSGYGPVIMAENAEVSFAYVSWDGTELVLPLTIIDLVESLRSIRVTVTVRSKQLLSSGVQHQVTVEQLVGLRNLNLFY